MGKQQKISGIYQIVNKINNHSYIGSSRNITRRWTIHKYHLEKTNHHSAYLQRAWKKYGNAVFDFVILEYIEPDTQLLFDAEKNWIEKVRRI